MNNRQINRKDGELAPWDRGITAEMIEEMAALSSKVKWHTLLIERANQLGYNVGVAGLCQGLGEAGANAFWVSILTDTDGLSAYLERMLLLAGELATPEENAALTPSYLSIFSFFDRVKLVHECQNRKLYHYDLMPHHQVTASALERLSIIEDITRPACMVTRNNKPISQVTIASFIGSYNIHELQDYLTCLANHLGRFPFELQLSCGDHIAFLCFCPTRSDWILFDANHIPLNVFTNADRLLLARQLMTSLYGNEKYVIISTNIRTANIFTDYLQARLDSLYENSRWEALHTIFSNRINSANLHGYRLLDIAAQAGNLRVVQALIKSGADVNNAIRGTNKTPLYAAAQNGHTSCVKELLAAGADVSKAYNFQNKSGCFEITPEEIARHYGYDEIADLIEQHTLKLASTVATL